MLFKDKTILLITDNRYTVSKKTIHTHNMQPNECYSDNNSDFYISNLSLNHNVPRPQSPCHFNDTEDTDPSLSPITNSKFSGQNIHTSFNSEQFSNYIQVDYETDIDVDDHIDFISCNSNCSYTNANIIPLYNDSSAMNSKLSYQAMLLIENIDPISESKSQTTESSDYFSNAKLQSLQNELHELKTHLEDFPSQSSNSSSENISQNINNSSFHENFYDTNTNSTFNLKNSVLDIGTDSVNLDIHPILTTTSPLQITENHTNFNDFSSVNAVNLDTHPIFTTASPIQITENHANFNDFSSVNATTSYSSDLSDEQICKNFKDNTFKSSLKSYSSPNVEHSNKRVQFQLNEKESNTKVNTNLNTSNLFPRKDNQISLGDSNQHNNSPSNSSPSPMMKDNRQTDPSYKPHPLYKNSQNISQMRLRSHTKQTQNVQNISPRKLRSHFK
ncbi:hypothetical protein Avbf_11133 [Armadillidium vulgare]|nr:hypothetical protein Avbf_11133 [Armadillidium vulgare]